MSERREKTIIAKNERECKNFARAKSELKGAQEFSKRVKYMHGNAARIERSARFERECNK